MGIGSRVCINFESGWPSPCYRLLRSSALTANWRPECYKRSLAIISSGVPRRISESSTTNMDLPVIARAHTFRGSDRTLCETIAHHRDHLVGFAGPSEHMKPEL